VEEFVFAAVALVDAFAVSSFLASPFFDLSYLSFGRRVVTLAIGTVSALVR